MVVQTLFLLLVAALFLFPFCFFVAPFLLFFCFVVDMFIMDNETAIFLN